MRQASEIPADRLVVFFGSYRRALQWSHQQGHPLNRIVLAAQPERLLGRHEPMIAVRTGEEPGPTLARAWDDALAMMSANQNLLGLDDWGDPLP